MRGGPRPDRPRRQRRGEILEGDFEAPVQRRRAPAKRWLVALGLLVLLLAAWLGWRNAAPVLVELPILNTGDGPVQLLLHGEGIGQHALVRLAPGERHTVKLTVGRGALRVRSEGERAKLDAVLIDDARVLKGASIQLEVRSAGELVLMPRSE